MSGAAIVNGSRGGLGLLRPAAPREAEPPIQEEGGNFEVKPISRAAHSHKRSAAVPMVYQQARREVKSSCRSLLRSRCCCP
jgi:hypothetical protein